MAISLELQSAALIDNLANLEARITSDEIEYELLKKSLSPSHPKLLRKQQILEETRKAYKEIQFGAKTRTDSVLSALDIPLSEIPELSLQFSVLKRNVKIQETIFELLAKQLEMSRIQERRDMPIINVLDKANSSQYPYSPRRLLIILATMLLTFMISVLLV